MPRDSLIWIIAARQPAALAQPGIAVSPHRRPPPPTGCSTSTHPRERPVQVVFIGACEGLDDLQPFDAQALVGEAEGSYETRPQDPTSRTMPDVAKLAAAVRRPAFVRPRADLRIAPYRRCHR